MSLRDALSELEASIAGVMTLSPGQQAAQALLQGDARHICLVGGTRSGKTTLIVREQMAAAVRFPGSRHAMLRYRGNAARMSLWNDTIPSVRRRCFPHIHFEEHRQDGFLELPNGSQIYVAGLDDNDRVEKILGTEYASVFLNEASQIPYSSAVIAWTRLAQVVPGLRQRAYVDLNPTVKGHWTNRLFGDGKRDPVTRMPVRDPQNYARIFLNPQDNAANLSQEHLEALQNLPARQRKRFYEGAYVEELEGALWTMETIERCRVAHADVPDLVRVVVAIDPAISVGDSANETGIVAAGRAADGRCYILADVSGVYTPTQWAEKAIALYYSLHADLIVAEQNQGGLMVQNTVKMVDASVNYKGVHASRGKITRAEPISALYSAGKVLHVGEGLSELEEQLVSYQPGNDSPDRLDAMVWSVTELAVRAQGGTFRSASIPIWGR